MAAGFTLVRTGLAGPIRLGSVNGASQKTLTSGLGCKPQIRDGDPCHTKVIPPPPAAAAHTRISRWLLCREIAAAIQGEK